MSKKIDKATCAEIDKCNDPLTTDLPLGCRPLLPILCCYFAPQSVLSSSTAT